MKYKTLVIWAEVQLIWGNYKSDKLSELHEKQLDKWLVH